MPLLPNTSPRPESATISPNGVTRFWSGTGSGLRARCYRDAHDIALADSIVIDHRRMERAAHAVNEWICFDDRVDGIARVDEMIRPVEREPNRRAIALERRGAAERRAVEREQLNRRVFDDDEMLRDVKRAAADRTRGARDLCAVASRAREDVALAGLILLEEAEREQLMLVDRDRDTVPGAWIA